MNDPDSKNQNHSQSERGREKQNNKVKKPGCKKSHKKGDTAKKSPQAKALSTTKDDKDALNDNQKDRKKKDVEDDKRDLSDNKKDDEEDDPEKIKSLVKNLLDKDQGDRKRPEEDLLRNNKPGKNKDDNT